MKSESFVTSNNVQIWTVSTGAGFPVVLCSGGPGCCDYLEPVAKMLDTRAQVIRFEERGCGRSEAAPPYNIETSVEDLENIRKFYKIERWIVGGHSWGADLALFYALEHGERTAGLMCIAGGRIHNDREWHSEYKQNEQHTGEKSPEFEYPINLEVNRQVSQSWKRRIQHPLLLREISQLNLPALFVYAADDIRPRWASEQLARLLPDARFELVENAEHAIWLTRPRELALLLGGFVDEIKQKETNRIAA